MDEYEWNVVGKVCGPRSLNFILMQRWIGKLGFRFIYRFLHRVLINLCEKKIKEETRRWIELRDTWNCKMNILVEELNLNLWNVFYICFSGKNREQYFLTLTSNLQISILVFIQTSVRIIVFNFYKKMCPRFSLGKYENKQRKRCFVETLGWDEETKLDIAIYTLKCGKQNGKKEELFSFLML